MSGFADIEKRLKEIAKKISVPVLKMAAIEGERSIRKNFDEGGRPVKWQPSRRVNSFSRKNPGADKNKSAKTLVKRGYLKNVTGVPDTSSMKVKFVTDPRAKAYAQIHNEGGTINRPAGKVRLRKKAGRSVFASAKNKKATEHSSKAHTINIPKREFLIIPPEDYPRIISSIAKQVKL